MEKRITSKTRIYIQNFKEQLKNKIVNDNNVHYAFTHGDDVFIYEYHKNKDNRLQQQ